MIAPSSVFVLSGDPETGKTRFTQRLVQAMHKLGWNVAGIVSPAIFQAGVKIAIDAQDLRSGERRRLAELIAESKLEGPATKRWQFSQESLKWCDRVLRSATPCDLLVIDELGPFEFEREAGMVYAFDAIDGNQYLAALIIIRPSLLERANRLWPHMTRINLAQADSHETLVTQWAQKLKPLKPQLRRPSPRRSQDY